MTKLDVHQFEYLSDNYGVLIHDAESGETAAIDAGEAAPLLDALKETGWNLTHLFITHHHFDHTGGLAEVKSETGCQVLGPKVQSTPISGLDILLSDGDEFQFAGRDVKVMSTPGHTTDMINFYIPSEKLIFTGDTLFALGCGRVFEGTAEMMWDSLSKFFDLPEDTHVYCGHEYTLANAKFALSVDPDNEMLRARCTEVEVLRAEGKHTVPSLLGEELLTNPFLRAADPAIRKTLGMESASDAEVFAEIRKRKDNF